LDDGVAPGELVGLVVARGDVHDSREMTGFEQPDAEVKVSRHESFQFGELDVSHSQESHGIELLGVLDSSSAKCECRPSDL
jgi:hypothetical protein